MFWKEILRNIVNEEIDRYLEENGFVKTFRRDILEEQPVWVLNSPTNINPNKHVEIIISRDTVFGILRDRDSLRRQICKFCFVDGVDMLIEDMDYYLNEITCELIELAKEGE